MNRRTTAIGVAATVLLVSVTGAWFVLTGPFDAPDRVATLSRASGCGDPQGPSSYRVTFISHWSALTHPEGFPRDAHYSSLIGATHQAGWRMWQPGALASPGIEVMAERGRASPLKDEIADAIRSGHAETMIRGDNLKRSPGTTSVDFRITRDFPQVSLVAMLAPSPDWFVGVANLDLCEGGRWTATRAVELFAFDAGTDSGRSYEAPDADTQPREPIARIEAPPFHVAGALRQVGTLTFEKQ